MPRSRPEAYSKSVSRPIKAAARAQRSAARGARARAFKPRETEARTKASAVLAFMAASPGKILFSAAASKLHPRSAATPTDAPIRLAPLASAPTTLAAGGCSGRLMAELATRIRQGRRGRSGGRNWPKDPDSHRRIEGCSTPSLQAEDQLRFALRPRAIGRASEGAVT